ncbi:MULTISPECIES: HalOD1 output domain-containing protein [Halorubrum]|nr:MULTISPECIES: HalOD1 output domain-containing protein [Halorubrum]MDB2250056.1 hypothetical protein [Halorubrum ezzemoulense]MDB2253393.1 hypothetical protein [Halorubrum ezzemoulense]
MAQPETPEYTMTDESRPTDELTASWHGRYVARWGNETPLYEAITDAVSTVTGDARSAVASRYDRTHAFALSQLFGGADEASTPSTGVVKFVLSECVVSVHSDGQLSVSLADRERNAID